MEKEITIVRTFDAPRERVWQAWNDPKALREWWGPRNVTIPVCEIDLRVGGDLHIVMLAGKELGPLAGERWPMRGTFKEVEQPEKLVFTNQAVDESGNVLLDGMTTVTLEEESGKTKLTVTTSAKGVVPQAPQMLAGMEQGWNEQLDKLGVYLAAST